MRHRKSDIKLGRTATHRNAMLRNMVTSLFEYDRIVTTIHKAKALRPLVDKMVGLAKRGKTDLHAYRQAIAVITKMSVVKDLFDKAATRFSNRSSGYTIMVKKGLRKGDAATLVILELMNPDSEKAKMGAGIAAKKSQTGDRAKRVAQSTRVATEEKPVAKAAAPVATESSAPGDAEPVIPSEAETKADDLDTTKG